MVQAKPSSEKQGFLFFCLIFFFSLIVWTLRLNLAKKFTWLWLPFIFCYSGIQKKKIFFNILQYRGKNLAGIMNPGSKPSALWLYAENKGCFFFPSSSVQHIAFTQCSVIFDPASYPGSAAAWNTQQKKPWAGMRDAEPSDSLQSGSNAERHPLCSTFAVQRWGAAAMLIFGSLCSSRLVPPNDGTQLHGRQPVLSPVIWTALLWH